MEVALELSVLEQGLVSGLKQGLVSDLGQGLVLAMVLVRLGRRAVPAMRESLLLGEVLGLAKERNYCRHHFLHRLGREWVLD